MATTTHRAEHIKRNQRRWNVHCNGHDGCSVADKRKVERRVEHSCNDAPEDIDGGHDGVEDVPGVNVRENSEVNGQRAGPFLIPVDHSMLRREQLTTTASRQATLTCTHHWR